MISIDKSQLASNKIPPVFVLIKESNKIIRIINVSMLKKQIINVFNKLLLSKKENVMGKRK